MMTKGKITERSILFNELKDLFFSNYRTRPAFFIMYDNKEFQVLFGKKFEMRSYEDIFNFGASKRQRLIIKNKKEILEFYLNKIKEVA